MKLYADNLLIMFYRTSLYFTVIGCMDMFLKYILNVDIQKSGKYIFFLITVLKLFFRRKILSICSWYRYAGNVMV